MRKLLLFCQLATLLVAVTLPQQALGKTSAHYSLKNIRRRELLQDSSPTQCQTQCPSSEIAAAGCSALSPSLQSSIRNTLISSCGISSTFSTGCCSAINGPQLQDYINCMCAGDSVLSGLSAFVDASAVVKTCGCSTSSEVTLGRSDLPVEMLTSTETPTTTTPLPPAPDSGKSADDNDVDEKSTTNPIAMEILASQRP
ncbi:hypothetical protein Ndes2526B_g03627 [Nannochloris sp. 'desiccata']